MSIKQAFDSLQDETVESLYKNAIKFGFLEQYKEKVIAINVTTISPQEKIKAQKALLIELEYTKIDEVYQYNLKNGKLERFESEIKAIAAETTAIGKAESQRALLIKAKFLKMEILIEAEFNRLTITDNAIQETIKTEKYYNTFMKRFLVDFMQKLLIEPLKDDLNVKKILTKLEILNDIVKLSDKILSEFRKQENIQNIDVLAQKIAQTLQPNAAAMESLYSKYATVYYEILEPYEALRETNQDFDKFCKTFEFSLMNDFAFYTLMPMQRISRYILLLKKISNYLPAQSSNVQAKNIIITALEKFCAIGIKINAIKNLFAQTKMFLAADGFKIKVKNIKYQNIKYQEIYPKGPTIFKNLGYVVENNEVAPQPDKVESTINDKTSPLSRLEAIIKDEYKREILRIKYRNDELGEHMNISCGSSEIQQFANDNVRYKGTKIMDIFEKSRKSNPAQILNQLEWQLTQLFENEFPDCCCTIERRRTNNEKFKITVKDPNGTEMLRIKEEQNGPSDYKIITAEDPHKQFFNVIELYERATKATSIVINATKENIAFTTSRSITKKTSPVCKVRPGNNSAIINAEYMKEFSDALISCGVKGIQIKHYPTELSAREICFLFEELFVLKNQNPNEDELQRIKILLDRYQGLLLAGYVPIIADNDSTLFSKYNNAHARAYTIETNDPILAIKQYEILMQNNVRVALSLSQETKEAIINNLGNAESIMTIDMKPIESNEDGLIKNKDHAYNLNKLQTAIQLGFIPVFKEDFLSKIHALNLKSLITISTVYPTIALKQWETLMGSGIPTKFDENKSDIKKQVLKNQSYKTIVINTTNAQNAIKSYKVALDDGFNPEFSEATKALVLAAIVREPTINKITVTNPTIDILQQILKNGLLLDLYNASLQTLIKNLKKSKECPMVELVNITSPNNISLLKTQIKQIENINAGFGTDKIKYTLTQQTKMVLAEPLPPKLIEKLKYFYRDLSGLDLANTKDKTLAFDSAIPKLTVLDQLIHEQILSFSTTYCKENLLTKYEANKQFFHSAEISEQCIAQINAIQNIINSIDNSSDSINKVRFKTKLTNNPAQRIEIMLLELKDLQNTIKNENSWWFSSRLIPILNQIITELIVIQTRHSDWAPE